MGNIGFSSFKKAFHDNLLLNWIYLKVPKRTSSSDSDKSTELPNIVVPETVPHDFTVIESDDDDNEDKHVTVKEVKPAR